jgi:integrase
VHTFKLSTRIGYISLLKNDLLPYFERTIFSEITPAQIQGFLAEKFRMGKSWSLVRNLRNLMRSILRTSVELNHLEENPATKTKLPSKPLRRPMHHLTTEQVTILLAEIREPYRSMALVAVLTGLRRGEVFGLRWGAVDLERRVLEVRESVYNGHFSTPKTNSSNRRVPLSSPVWGVIAGSKSQSQFC